MTLPDMITKLRAFWFQRSETQKWIIVIIIAFILFFNMNEKLITALLAILLALGGWNLSQTFSLSNQMVLVKEKVNNIEENIQKFSKKKPKKKKKKN